MVPEIYMVDIILKEITTMPDIIPASTSLLVMMDLRYMIYILTTINIMKQMAGTTQTERTITEAGTAVWKEIRMIQKY